MAYLYNVKDNSGLPIQNIFQLQTQLKLQRKNSSFLKPSPLYYLQIRESDLSHQIRS